MKKLRIKFGFRNQNGFAMIDALFGVLLLGLVAVAYNQVALRRKKAATLVDVEAARSQVIERYYSIINNPAAWRNTFLSNLNLPLQNHLNPATGDPTAEDPINIDPPAAQTINVYTADDPLKTLIIPAAGLLVDLDGVPLVSPTEQKARFIVKAMWWKRAHNTAIVLLTVKFDDSVRAALKKPNLQEAAARADVRLRLFKAPIFKDVSRCIEAIRPLVSGSSGGHGNFNYVPIPIHTSPATDPGNNNFTWDYAKVSCPTEYYLSMVYIEEGCNVLASRVFAPNAREGTCHQISAFTPEQRAGCGALSPNSRCIARCCTFN